jgi:hypothetical protein
MRDNRLDRRVFLGELAVGAATAPLAELDAAVKALGATTRQAFQQQPMQVGSGAPESGAADSVRPFNRRSVTPMHATLFSAAGSLGLFVLVLAPPVTAQLPTSRPEVAKREAVIQTLRDSQWVRLVSPALARREGQLLVVNSSELVLARHAQPLRVPAADIDSLWVRGRATKTGALLGGLVGAVAGVGAGLFISQVICSTQDCGVDDAAPVLGLGAGGLAGGALVGALIGSAVPKWRLRFP